MRGGGNRGARSSHACECPIGGEEHHEHSSDLDGARPARGSKPAPRESGASINTSAISAAATDVQA